MATTAEFRKQVNQLAKLLAKQHKWYAGAEWCATVSQPFYFSIRFGVQKETGKKDTFRLHTAVGVKPFDADEVLWATLFPNKDMGGPRQRVRIRANGAFATRPLQLITFTDLVDESNVERMLSNRFAELEHAIDAFVEQQPTLSSFADSLAERFLAGDTMWQGETLLATSLVAAGRNTDAIDYLRGRIAEGDHGSLVIGDVRVHDALLDSLTSAPTDSRKDTLVLDEQNIQLWTSVARALRADAPPGTSVSQFTGSAGPSSWGGSIDDDGDSSARYDQPDRPREREFMDALEAAAGVQAQRGVAVHIRVDAGGAGRVTVIELPDSVESGASAPISAVTRIDGALPEVFRREAVLPPAGSAAGDAADAAALTKLTELIQRRMPDAVGASAQLIDAAEQQLGVALPAEVRALYSAAGSGELILSDDEDAPGFYGFEIIPLDDTDHRTAYTPAHRFPGWTYGASAAAETAPDGAVQPLAGSPYWFPIAHDWGGNVYAVDLAPGPEGVVGQVLFLDHEVIAGAVRIAASLTEMLLGEEAPRIPGTDTPNPVVYINDRSGRTVAEASALPIQALNIGVVAEPVDLSPLIAGSSPAAASLRSFKAEPGSLVDPLQLAQLAGLEFLELSPADWQVLFDHDAVPTTLLAASVNGHDLLAIVEVSNRLLAAWSRPLITTAVIELDLGPEDAAAASASSPGDAAIPPTPATPAAEAVQPPKRRWFRRR